MPETVPPEGMVFVIDDDASLRRSLENLFASVDLRVQSFGSAAEFLQSKLVDDPSCLVLDVRLPGVSGLDFQAQLADANIRLPVIFITGHGDIPMTVRAMLPSGLVVSGELARPNVFRSLVGRTRLQRHMRK